VTRRLNTFNVIAPFYDLLGTLVFWGSLHRSQLTFIGELRGSKAILILGGGTGRILPLVLDNAPQATIVFIDASAEMIARAKQRVSPTTHIRFVHGTEEYIPDDVYFDAVITNFYFDLFPEPELLQVLSVIKSRLSRKALWLVTDFVAVKPWHNFMLQLMYLMFRRIGSVENSRLPDWATALKVSGFEVKSVRYFCAGFIRSSVSTN